MVSIISLFAALVAAVSASHSADNLPEYLNAVTELSNKDLNALVEQAAPHNALNFGPIYFAANVSDWSKKVFKFSSSRPMKVTVVSVFDSNGVLGVKVFPVSCNQSPYYFRTSQPLGSDCNGGVDALSYSAPFSLQTNGYWSQGSATLAAGSYRAKIGAVRGGSLVTGVVVGAIIVTDAAEEESSDSHHKESSSSSTPVPPPHSYASQHSGWY